jgi:hypothetical protein
VSDEVALVLGHVIAEGAVERFVNLLDEVLRLLAVHQHWKSEVDVMITFF